MDIASSEENFGENWLMILKYEIVIQERNPVKRAGLEV